jgi:DNA-binding transcriptional regulator PaaX
VLDAGAADAADEVLAYQFTLSIAVLRHLQLDPLLPAALLPDDWPAPELRRTYGRFDTAFKRRLNGALRSAVTLRPRDDACEQRGGSRCLTPPFVPDPRPSFARC